MKYKLLIVDDNIGLANNISIFINKNISNLIEIIGIANNGEVAIDVIKKLKPDILLLD